MNSNCPTGRPVVVYNHIRRHADDGTLCGVQAAEGVHTQEEFNISYRKEYDAEALQVSGVERADDNGVLIDGTLSWDDVETLGRIAYYRRDYA